MSICKKCLVTGNVQGVFFRASSQSMAKKLDITGYAINLADGRVELLVCGDDTKVEQFSNWLWTGPSGATVIGVQCENVKEVSPDYFTIA